MFSHLICGKKCPKRSSTACKVPRKSSGRDSHNEWKCSPSMPSGKDARPAAGMPKREEGLAGLYKSVSTVEYSGFTRKPHDTPARRARAPKRSYWLKELKVM